MPSSTRWKKVAAPRSCESSCVMGFEDPAMCPEVISDPTCGHYIYKLSARNLTVDTRKPGSADQFPATLSRQHAGISRQCLTLTSYSAPPNPAMPPLPMGANPPAPKSKTHTKRLRLDDTANHDHRPRGFGQSGPAARAAALGLRSGGRRCHAPNSFPG